MSATADAISKIKMNKELREFRTSKFKSSKFVVSVNGSVYNTEYLKTKFSKAKQELYLNTFAQEKRNQKILNWTFWFLILFGLFYLCSLVFI